MVCVTKVSDELGRSSLGLSPSQPRLFIAEYGVYFSLYTYIFVGSSWLEGVGKVCVDASCPVAITRSLLWSGIAVGSGCCSK